MRCKWVESRKCEYIACESCFICLVMGLCLYLIAEAGFMSAGCEGGGGGGSCGRPYMRSPVRLSSSFIWEYGRAAREYGPSRWSMYICLNRVKQGRKSKWMVRWTRQKVQGVGLQISQIWLSICEMLDKLHQSMKALPLTDALLPGVIVKYLVWLNQQNKIRSTANGLSKLRNKETNLYSSKQLSNYRLHFVNIDLFTAFLFASIYSVVSFSGRNTLTVEINVCVCTFTH